MEIRSFGASWAVRPALCLVIVGAASGAFAQLNLRPLPMEFMQFNQKIEPTVERTTGPSSDINTYQFFPQVDRSITAKTIKPAHKGTPRGTPRGLPNSMSAGALKPGSFALTNAKFGGLEFNGPIPPDPTIAVGPSHIVQGVNTRFAIYKKSDGQLQFSQSSQQFFSGLGAPAFHSDPRVFYDQFNSRWLVLIIAIDFGSGISNLLVGVSDDSDPNGTWHRYVLNSEVTINGTDMWLDYPMVGYSKDGYVVAGNMFGFSNGFGGAQAFAFPSAGLYAGTGTTVTGFTIGGDSVHPADGYNPSASTVFAMQTATSTSIRLLAFQGLPGTPTLTTTTVAVQAYNSNFFATAPSGGAGSLDAIADRIITGAYRDDFLLGAHTVLLPGQSRTSVRWYEFDLGTWPTSGVPNVAQQGNITLDSGQYALMPAITKNSFGDISIVYTRSSTSIFSDLVISSRVAADPPGTIGPPTFIRGGLSSNNGGLATRWGDYFAAVIDPTDDTTFWGDGEVTRADGWWSTEIMSWTVTTGGPGGGGGVDYDTIALSTFMGVYNAGGLTEVTASDNLTFDVDSVLRPGQGHFGGIQADFLIAEPSANVTSLTFTVEANVDPGVTATGMVFLWNWNTNQFEYGKAFDVQKLGNDLQATKIKANPGRYVSSTGQVRMVFRAHDPFRRRGTSPSPFRLRTDLVKLNVKT